MRCPSTLWRRRRLSKTPPLPLLLLLLLWLVCEAEADARAVEREALLQFKSCVISDPAGILSSWTDSPSSDHCLWLGVTCDSGSRVSALNISSRGQFSSSSSCFSSIPNPFRDGACSDPNSRLVGKLSPEIRRLTELRVLSLPVHGFFGELPEVVAGLENLEVLDLEGNLLSGKLPARFGPRLRVIELGFNDFGGEIPESLLSGCVELETLDLSHNHLNGTIPPSLFSDLHRLKGLYLSFNLLGGSIPDAIGNECSSLEHLELSGNLLVGSIPSSLANCGELQTLVLFSNLVDGAVPKELGRLAKLQVLDLSRNCLSGPLPVELGNCLELSVLVLSNMYRPLTYGNNQRKGGDFDDFNYFQGGIHENITSLPKLRILWAPRATLEGKVPSSWGACGSLEMVNLGQNLLTGEIPAVFGQCKNLKYLNLSLNNLSGWLDERLPVPCMTVFDVRGNQLSGSIPRFIYSVCPSQSPPNDVSSSYSSFFEQMARMESSLTLSGSPIDSSIIHDFGKNNFTGSFPFLPVATERLGKQTIYALLVDRNNLFGSFPGRLFDNCKYMHGLILNISNNLMSGVIPAEIDVLCRSLIALDVSGNRITGTIPPHLGLMDSLISLDLSRNNLHGQIPASFGPLKALKHLSLSGNNLTGGIPFSLGQLYSLKVLDLSSNSLSGGIPSDLAKLGNLSVLLLNNNKLSGRIPPGVVNVTSLSMFNVSFNNLSGPVPLNAITMRCDCVIGNPLLESCHVVSLSVPPSDLQGPGGQSLSYTASPPGNSPSKSTNGGFNNIEIASITSAAAIVSVLLALCVLYIYTRKCAPRSTVRSSGRRDVTIFRDIGVPLTYENVVRATGSFNATNCIGSGGFGATYKAEIAPGVVVAVKRLSVGRIQGVQQFHAEVKTLGRWRHPNLVTLIGFHLSEGEMFLIYNYLSGGNLENFIQNRSKRPVDWRMLHKIALDVACALAYLHDQCVPRILHRDVKPSNILLDNEYNAYLSDFGLARLLGNSETHATTGVAGTFGYVAPEYAMTCRVSDKADVYSYGVVLLELISDKKALDPSFSPYGNGFNIVAWAHMLLRKGRAHEFFTKGLWNVGPHDDLVDTLHLAIKCTDDSLSARPTMKYVVQQLRQMQPLASPAMHVTS